MLIKAIKQNFGWLNQIKSSFNKSKQLINTLSVPQNGYYSRFENTELGFEEVAIEYIANYTEMTYELSATQSSDFYSAQNFGTIDNPHLIFTQNYPYRYVGCTGQPNEDEYEGHELFWFVLREGPMQRCSFCGQVYKLIRLRDNHEENNYYSSYVLNQNIDDLGASENLWHTSPRATMSYFNYPTQLEDDSSHFYSLINPDDHDHYLVDPAYRLKRAEEAEKAFNVLNDIQNKASQQYSNQFGFEKNSLSKQDFENLVEGEIAMKKWDMHSQKVFKFNLRYLLDPKNHNRREQRMIQRSQDRVQNKETIYLNGSSETELQYMDYYETDIEADGLINKLNEVQQYKQEILQDSTMQAKNIIFRDDISSQQIDDPTSIIQNKIFKFKYRESFDTIEEFQNKEKLRISKFQSRIPIILQKLNDYINANKKDSKLKELEYYEELVNSAIFNYESYFNEQDPEFQLIKSMPITSKFNLIQIFEHDALAELLKFGRPTHISMDKPNSDNGITNYSYEWLNNLQNQMIPQLNNIDQMNFNEQILNTLIDNKSDEKEQITNKKDSQKKIDK